MNPGLYNWKVAAFNGFSRTFSEQQSFEMCTPGTLGLPSLNPSSGTMEVGNVSLSWTVSWNDTCFENHAYSMMIWNSSSRILFNSGELNSSQTSVFFDEEEAGLLGLKNSVTYSWGVEAKKGSQSKQTNSTFVYCKPASEVIQLSTPVFPFANGTVVLSWSTVSGTNCGRNVTYSVFINSSSEFHFNSPANEVTSQKTVTVLLDDGIYYWAVVSFNGLSFTSDVSTFRVCTAQPPSSPKVISPADGNIVLVPVTLSWSAGSVGKACTITGSAELLVLMDIEQNDTRRRDDNTPPTTVVANLPIDSSFWNVPTSYSVGTYSWMLTVSNGQSNSSSTVQKFTSCVPVAPGSFNLTGPANFTNNTITTPVTLGWTIPDAGESCSNSNTSVFFNVFMSQNNPPDFFGEVESNSLSFTVLSDGQYFWTIIASNGFYSTPSSEIRSFTVCNPTAPAVPIQIYPLNGEYIPDKQFNLTFFAPGSFGTMCKPEIEAPFYTIQYWTSTSSVYSTNMYEPGEIELPVDDLQQTQWFWKVSATNRDLIEIYSDTMVFMVCRYPTSPILSSPGFNATEVFNLDVVLEWDEITSAMIGTPCSTVFSVPQINVLLNSEDELSGTLEPYTVLTNLSSSSTETQPLDLLPNKTYYWQVQLTNGREWAHSPVWIFKTRSRDCSSVYCYSDGGSCNETTLECECAFGWTGPECNIPPPKDDSLNIALVAGCAAGGAVLFGLILCAVTALVVRKKRKKVKLEAPEYAKFMFWPVTVLPISPKEQMRIDSIKAEVMMMVDGNFDPIFNMLRSLDVCDSDNVLKALVYAYCHKSRGLEFLIYLISKETQLCPEPSQLFRADSYSTKAFKYYIKLIGLPYLFEVLSPIIAEMMQRHRNDAEIEEEVKEVHMDAVSAGFELDPELMNEASDGSLNMLLLTLTCQKVVTHITKSSRLCPWQLRKIIIHIKEEVGKKFPGYEHVSMGAFLFLRYVVPAIAVPSEFGILTSVFSNLLSSLSPTEFPGRSLARELMLVCKLMQALSNRLVVKSKEDFMRPLEGFVEDNIPVVDAFYKEIEESFYQSSGDFNEVPDEIYDQCITVILCSWDKFVRSKKKAHKKRKDAPIERLEDRPQSMPSHLSTVSTDSSHLSTGSSCSTSSGESNPANTHRTVVGLPPSHLSTGSGTTPLVPRVTSTRT